LTAAQRSTATVATILGAVLLLLAFLHPDDAGRLRYALLAPALVAVAIAGVLAALSSSWVSSMLRDNAYAVTDRRAIVVRGSRITEYGPAHIVYVHVYLIADGIADVIFREGPNLGGLPDPKRRQGRELNPIGFKRIRDAEAAATALWALREGGTLASRTSAWEPSTDGNS
jgi:Flp pilus assembly pilin Flp